MNDEILQGYSIQAFLQSEQSSKWNPDTRRCYSNYLHELLRFCQEAGAPTPELLHRWQQTLQGSYKHTAVNVRVAAANNYFRWCGRPDLLQRQPRTGDDDGPEPPALSRTEYLKLLRAARTGGQHRLYLLIKLFATTGVPLQCLDQVTAELVRQGRGTLNYRGSPVPFRCPPALRQELLDYMAETGIYRGPVFITRTGQVWNRSNIFRRMQELCLRAGVPEEKANPRCLRNLYKATQQTLDQRLAALKQQMYDQLLEMEQDAVGWPAGPDTGRGRPA